MASEALFWKRWVILGLLSIVMLTADGAKEDYGDGIGHVTSAVDGGVEVKDHMGTAYPLSAGDIDLRVSSPSPAVKMEGDAGVGSPLAMAGDEMWGSSKIRKSCLCCQFSFGFNRRCCEECIGYKIKPPMECACCHLHLGFNKRCCQGC